MADTYGEYAAYASRMQREILAGFARAEQVRGIALLMKIVDALDDNAVNVMIEAINRTEPTADELVTAFAEIGG